jgi:hypothetical protein
VKKSLLIGLSLVGVVGLTTSSGVVAWLDTVPATVLDTAAIACPLPDAPRAEAVRLVGTRLWDGGAIALYTAQCPTDAQRRSVIPVFGHNLLQRDGMNWVVDRTASYGIKNPAPVANKLINYGTSQGSLTAQPSSRIPATPMPASPTQRNAAAGRSTSPGPSASPAPAATQAAPRDRYAILYGQVLSPDVKAVTATFDNGKIVRDTVPDGTFALIVRGATQVCSLRILGSGNQILGEVNVSQKQSQTGSPQAPTCAAGARSL